MKYLQLIRYQNLILLALMQLIFRFGFLKLQAVPLALTDWQYLLLVLSTVLIAAGGYVINDIFDQDTDAENKPEKVVVGKSISEDTAYYIYAGLTLSGVGIGMYLSNVIYKPGFLTLFILIATLLYFYATTLKQIAVLGNLTVAALLAFSVLIIGFFDLYPMLMPETKASITLVFSMLKDYALFAFLINFIREMVKDMEDIQGDSNQGMRTLPVIIGIGKTTRIVFVLLLFSLLTLLLYAYNNILVNDLIYSVIYVLVCIIAPLLFCIIQIWQAKEKKQFHTISTVLKWVILFGILSITVITYNIIGHATT